LEPAPKIIELNSRIRRYAARAGAVYLDYHSALADSAGGLKSGLGKDAVHPNLEGYSVMAPLAERAIAKALKTPLKTR
jgi:lysophospholipase L1-like esterase